MSKKKDEAFAQFVKAMGSCLRGVAPGVLKAATDVSEDAFVAAAAAFLCGFEPHQPSNQEVIRVCLDALAQSQSPAAIALLNHVAHNAAIGRIKVEAVRRLGCVNLTEGARGVLHTLAKDGFKPAHQFPGEAVLPEEFRVAAVEALGKAARPSKSDVQTVREVLAKEAEGRQPTPLFRAAVDAAHAMAMAFPVATLLDITGKCPVGLMRLHILAASSSQTPHALRKHATAFAPLLCGALSECGDEQPLRQRLTNLVTKTVSPELIRQISERFSSETLDSGRGAICLATLAAYKKTDDVLTSAYLAFARTQGNVHTGSPCVQGLSACSSGGRADSIVARLVHQDNPGYHQLLTCGLLLEVLGTVPLVVNSICDAFDAVQDPRRRSQSVERCCDAILAASLLSEPNGIKEDDRNTIKRQPQWRSHWEQNRMAEMVAALRRCPADRNGVVLLAARMTAAGPLPGTIAMAEWFAGRQDDLGEYFIETALRAAGNVAFSPSEGLPKECPLAQIEDLVVSQHQPKLRELLPRIVYADVKLNRFVLDLMRHRKIGFQQAAGQVLQGHLTAGDAMFVLESLALETDDLSAMTIAGATEFYSPDKKVTAAVRENAITLACQALAKRALSASPVLVEAILQKLHGRFEDGPTVRLAAYAACGRLADSRSIVPLKNRLKSDSDGKCAEAIRDSLKRIGDRLKTARPVDSDAGALVTWLGHVGDLGDKMLLPDVLPLLSPSHPSPEVRAGALWCLEHIGDPSVIPQIDEFVVETSPSDRILQAARHAKMALLGRDDLGFVEVLSKFVPADSPVLDPSIDYAKEFGVARVKRLARRIEDAQGQWEVGHWGDFVTALNGICEVLSSHLFEARHVAMGLERAQAEKMCHQKHFHRVNMSEFRKAFPEIQAVMNSILQMRGDAETAHVEDPDGSGKPGVQQSDAEHARNEFLRLLEDYAHLASHC